jgi:hypothetical protein
MPSYDMGPDAGRLAPEQEAEMLKTQARHLEGDLDEIRKRIEELEAAREKEG